MTDFSPAAQSVLDAFLDSPVDAGNYYATRSRQIAAVLRAAADQVLAAQWEGRIEPDAAHSIGINWTRDALFAIAAELEAGQ